MLDQAINKVFRVALILILLCLPISILVQAYSPKYGFLDLILFGQEREEKHLDVIKQMDLERKSRYGYDGQHYAQLAIDPLLFEAATAEAANGAYRVRRIGLPFISYVTGIGDSYFILQIYALSNFAFWILLLWILHKYIGLSTIKQFLLAFALLWTSGTVTSLNRALLDLPAAVLVLLAVMIAARPYAAPAFFSYAVLIKESVLASVFTLLWPERKKILDRRLITTLLIICIPFLLWTIYVRFRLSSWGNTSQPAFGMPLVSIIEKYRLELEALVTHYKNAVDGTPVGLFAEILAMVSLSIQSFYLFFKPRFYSIYWRLGIGFAVVFYIITMLLLAEQYSYSRTLLLLTFSFNLLIYQYEQGTSFLPWYIAGNAGLASIAAYTLVR